MKKSAIFAAAFVLTLGLAQCKKEQPNAQITEGETVHITVNVNNNGSRADIQDPSTGHYDFKDDDKLYVGYNNAYVGTLDYSTSANKFSGVITISQSGSQRLHFYYLGGGTATQVVGTQQYTVDISDQSENYPVISYGTSNVDYTGTGTYSTTLLNQCALVEFTTNEIPTTTAVSISGMKNKVTVDFNGNTLTPSSEGTGSIKLHAENATSRWAILLANEEEVESTASAEGYDATGITIPAINNNYHWTQANGKNISFTMTEAASTVIDLANVNSDITVGDGAILTGTLDGETQSYMITIAAGATVTLDDVTINGVWGWENEYGDDGEYYSWAGLTCLGDATIILKDGTTNTVKGFYENYPGIYVPESSTLTIQGGAEGTGSLEASSNGFGAGIGGGFDISCGNIRIEGGNVTANGGGSAAGIGGGGNLNWGTCCGTVTISGGTVTANGGENAAGIGGGNDGSCGAITITTGVTSVTATKGADAPNSIGAGDGGSCDKVTIGGVVFYDANNGGYQNGYQALLQKSSFSVPPFSFTLTFGYADSGNTESHVFLYGETWEHLCQTSNEWRESIYMGDTWHVAKGATTYVIQISDNGSDWATLEFYNENGHVIDPSKQYRWFDDAGNDEPEEPGGGPDE